MITETAEMEAEQEAFSSIQVNTQTGEIGRFDIKLGSTYYYQGIVNPGVEASQLLGVENETLVISLTECGRNRTFYRSVCQETASSRNRY